MEYFADMRHITHRCDVNTDDLDLESDPEELIKQLTPKTATKQRPLFKSIHNAVVYKARICSFVQPLRQCNGKYFIRRVGDTLSGILFENVVPRSITLLIRNNSIKIPTFGNKIFLFKVPLFLIASSYMDIHLSFPEDVTGSLIYDWLCSSDRRWMATNSHTCIYDGFYLTYCHGMIDVTFFVRPLKHIVQNVIGSVTRENKLLMQRSLSEPTVLSSQ